MEYKVVVTVDAEEDLNQYIRYLLMVKKSDQAAKNVLDDFEATIQSLKSVAGSLKPCRLQKRKSPLPSARQVFLCRYTEKRRLYIPTEKTSLHGRLAHP
ncbi:MULTISPECIES: hypothetical protein [unclassified Bilifractor]|uniref:hypothetical protein n=1 Tax=unclassified Bilifractor TaxID=2815795 RepID=UPI003F924D07